MTLVEIMEKDEVSLLGEELVHLTIKSSLIEPKGKHTLLCSVWTKKFFNPDSFRAQMRSIWKSSKKFEIEMVGQDLFLITFYDETDMEQIMDGRLWFFRRQLVLFERLDKPIYRNQIKMIISPLWLKISSCPLKCDKKDLMHDRVNIWRVASFGGCRKFLSFVCHSGCVESSKAWHFCVNQ